MFKNEVKFTCSHCGTENVYKLDFSRALHKLDDVSLEPEDFTYRNASMEFKFKLRYPSVKLVSDFHKANVPKYRTASQSQVQTLDKMSNVDYVNLFIEEIEIVNSATGTSKTVNLRDYAVGDIEDILAAFPQDVMFSEAGVI